MGLAPLTEQANQWMSCTPMDDSQDETSDEPPCLSGHSVIMYHTIRHNNSGWGSIAVNLDLMTILRMIEAPLRGSEKDAIARQREIRDYVQQTGECVTLIVYDWPQDELGATASHLIKQVIVYRAG